MLEKKVLIIDMRETEARGDEERDQERGPRLCIAEMAGLFRTRKLREREALKLKKFRVRSEEPVCKLQCTCNAERAYQPACSLVS